MGDIYQQSDKISIIVANYNHSAYVSQALDSLADQTYKNIEVIVVDDGSKDNSRDLIDDWINSNQSKLQHPVKKIYLPENKGKWFALNKGISEATGTLIAIQDADDRSCIQRIERQYQCLKQAGSYHNLCCFVHCWSQEDMEKHKDFKINKEPIFSEQLGDYMPHKEVTKWVLQGRNTPGINHFYIGLNAASHGASCLFYKQLWSNGMRFLPGSIGVRCALAEDGDFNTKMTLLLQRTSVLLEPLYLYRRNTATNPAFLENL